MTAEHPDGDGGWPARVLRRLLHRSPSGPDREVRVAGVQVCRRCTALGGGALVGVLVAAGLGVAPTAEWAVLAGPALVEALLEKRFGHRPRPRSLLVANAVAGAVAGAWFVGLLRAAGVLVAAATLAAGRMVTLATGRGRTRRRGGRRPAPVPS